MKSNRKLIKSRLFINLVLIILCMISITSANVEKTFCGVANHKVTISKTPTSYSQKIVNPHGIRIKYLQPPASSVKLDLAQLNNMLAVSAFFFKQLLTVSDVDMDTKFDQQDCGSIKAKTSTYAKNGFNTKQYDTIVSTETYYDGSVSTVAFAGPCQVGPWPIYAKINFNYAKFDPNPTKTAKFQSNLIVILHEQTHIFAFISLYFEYGLFKVSYLSSQYIPKCQTIAKYNNRWFLITPNVRAWVQRHYGCNSQEIGGLLVDQGNDQVGSHWDKKITFDEYMNAFVTPGFKITPLTLNLFKDTGFYYNVDFSLANDMKFGKNKGCNFALGLQTSKSTNLEYCPKASSNPSSNLLDFYNLASGYCNQIDSTVNIVQAYSNTVCNDQSNKNQGINQFGAYSRSFIVQSNSKQARCLIAKCGSDSSTIQITVQGKTGTCVNGGASTVVISGYTVYCPSNFYIFCSQQDCLNHCGGVGYCSKGSCLSETLCSSISSDCVRCKNNKCTGCKLGLFPTGKNNPACDTCSKVMPQCQNGCEVNHSGVTICKQFFSVTPITGTCPECKAIKYCQTCKSDRYGGTSCLTCSFSSDGVQRFPSTDQQKCQACNELIPNCKQCVDFGSQIYCQTCNSGYSNNNWTSCKKNRNHLKKDQGLSSTLDMI